MRIKAYLLVTVFMLLIALLVSCGSSDAVDGDEETDREVDNEAVVEEKQEGEIEEYKILLVALNAQPPTIDPLISTATVSRDVALQIFEPLVTINENLQPEPMLAESYETSEDGKTITFELREGVKFHNGEEMTAEDVVASMERWQEYSSRAKAAFSESTFTADGDYRVLLETTEPNRTALTVLSSSTQFPAIMPKEIIETADADGVTEFIGTGPFKFEEWKQDQYIRL